MRSSSSMADKRSHVLRSDCWCEPDVDDYSEPDEPDGIVDAWSEEGSDQLMDFAVLTRIRQEAIAVELKRQRRLERRGE